MIMTNVIWEPQPKQRLFLSRGEYETLFGGAAGGGKSDAMLAEALRQVNIPHYKGIIFRKTYPQLTELIDRSMAIYKRAFPRSTYNDQKHCWRFPSGAKIYFGSMQHEQDKTKYQGKAFDFIGFDELTHFTFSEYSYMFSRNRPTGPGTRCYIKASCNPGGIGHAWVKSRFITPAPPMTPIKDKYQIILPNGHTITETRSRIFIPSMVFDNQKLIQNNPKYVASLAMLPEKERNALMYGDWDSFEGQAFTEWKNAQFKTGINGNMVPNNKFTHVIEPFEIPDHWRIYRGFDWGYSKPFSVGWYVFDTKGKMYRICEYYGCTGQPNEGVKMEPHAVAKEIRRIEDTHELLKGRKCIGIADPAIFDKSTGPSIAESMEGNPYYISFSPADHKRIPGKMQVHYRLAFDERGDSMFQVFNTCKNFIRTLPDLIYSSKNVEDIDTDGEDHIYDEFRYVCMENTISPRKNIITTQPQDDPLNLFNKKVISFYNR